MLEILSCVAAMAAPIVAGGVELPSAVAVVGQPTGGSNGLPLTGVNEPFTTTDGRVAFTGAVDDGMGGTTNIVWFDGFIVWRNSDALPIVLTGGESTMGIGDAGQWIYSPSEEGDDSVWSNGAALLTETDPAPGFEGQFNSFNSRPQMNADGTPTWIAGVTATKGGSTNFRVLYVGLVPVLAAGDTIEGETISSGSGIGFAYDFSRDGSQAIVRVTLDAPSSSNDAFASLDQIIAREGSPTGQGDNWQGFGDCKVNNAGTNVFSGDTDGDAATDGYLARNGAIVVREGDVVEGRTLVGTPRAVGLNDLGQFGAIWDTSLGEALFLFEPDATGGIAAQVLLAVGDLVDLDGDEVADGAVSDFNASTVVGPGLDMPRQCRVCANVDVSSAAGGTVEAIVCVALPAGEGIADLDGNGAVNGADLGLLLAQWGGPGIADLNCDGVVDGADLGILLADWTG